MTTILLLLAALTVAVFWPVHDYQFINVDDPQYVFQNPVVARGLSWSGVGWAFSSLGYASNWHPLTWLSHMADVQLFGLAPGRHHLTNLLFHLANTLLLFLVLRGMTGALFRSALVAALFAVHPLHVESVAWVSERKDVLSTLFLLLTLGAYLRNVRRPSPARYLATTAALLLGLLAKPMLVTLPLALLLLDFWPLDRWRSRGPARLLLEKLPWLALAGASSVLTVVAQGREGVVFLEEGSHLAIRAAVAIIGYARYLAKAFWPPPLSFLYPFPGAMPPLWQTAGAAALLVALSAAAFAGRRRHPAALVGWFWFFGTLVPVAGFVKVGYQSIADRYTYVPYIGLFLVAVWVGSDLAARRTPRGRMAVGAAAVLLVVAAAVGARARLPVWRSSRALFAQASGVYPDSTWLRVQLISSIAQEAMEAGRLDEARAGFLEVLRLRPNSVAANYALGKMLLDQRRSGEAVPYLQAAVRLNPREPKSFWRLGRALDDLGRTNEAISRVREGVRHHPESASLLQLLGALLIDVGRPGEALSALTASLRIQPADATTHFFTGLALEKLGDRVRAGEHLRKALQIEPDHAAAGRALERLRRSGL